MYCYCLKLSISGYSIRKSAKAVGVCVKTSFYMRHKLLDCIRAYIAVGHVEGILKLDEKKLPSRLKAITRRAKLFFYESHVNGMEKLIHVE